MACQKVAFYTTHQHCLGVSILPAPSSCFSPSLGEDDIDTYFNSEHMILYSGKFMMALEYSVSLEDLLSGFYTAPFYCVLIWWKKQQEGTPC